MALLVGNYVWGPMHYAFVLVVDMGMWGGLYPGGLLLLFQWSKHVTSIILSISMVQKHVIHLDGWSDC